MKNNYRRITRIGLMCMCILLGAIDSYCAAWYFMHGEILKALESLVVAIFCGQVAIRVIALEKFE